VCLERANSILVESEFAAREQDLLPILLSLEHERIRFALPEPVKPGETLRGRI